MGLVQARAMTWPEYKEFNKFRREFTLKLRTQFPDVDKEFIDEALGEETVDWILRNVYKELDINTIGVIEANSLAGATVQLSVEKKDAEAKN